VAQRQLHVVLHEFQRTIRECQRFADDARLWALHDGAPRISVARRDSIIELAFLRGFLAWESFLEESFILHMLGKQPLRGRPPHRYVLPPNRKAALDLSAGGRKYASWEAATEVATRATRFFRDGRPYTGPLRTAQNVLGAARTLRNAVAHRSEAAQKEFEKLARNELGGTLRPALTVGGFLNTPKPASDPPESFLNYYLGVLQVVAEQIIRPPRRSRR
jgi:hypothetical protein